MIEDEAEKGRRWSIDELLAMSPADRVRAQEAMQRHAIEAEDRERGPLRAGEIGVEKGRLPTITHLVESRSDRDRRARGENRG